MLGDQALVLVEQLLAVLLPRDDVGLAVLEDEARLDDLGELGVVGADRHGHGVDRAGADQVPHLVELGLEHRVAVGGALALVVADEALGDRGAGAGDVDERDGAVGVAPLEPQRRLGGAGQPGAVALRVLPLRCEQLAGLESVGVALTRRDGVADRDHQQVPRRDVLAAAGEGRATRLHVDLGGVGAELLDGGGDLAGGDVDGLGLRPAERERVGRGRAPAGDHGRRRARVERQGVRRVLDPRLVLGQVLDAVGVVDDPVGVAVEAVSVADRPGEVEARRIVCCARCQGQRRQATGQQHEGEHQPQRDRAPARPARGREREEMRASPWQARSARSLARDLWSLAARLAPAVTGERRGGDGRPAVRLPPALAAARSADASSADVIGGRVQRRWQSPHRVPSPGRPPGRPSIRRSMAFRSVPCP